MKNIYEIKYNKNDLTINNLLFKYSSLINIPNDQLYFLYKSKNINNIKKISELNDITIFVYNIKMKKNKNNEELTDIICPKCKNLTIINNNNDKLSINCLNNHKFIDLTINSFYENSKKRMNRSEINNNDSQNEDYSNEEENEKDNDLIYRMLYKASKKKVNNYDQTEKYEKNKINKEDEKILKK